MKGRGCEGTVRDGTEHGDAARPKDELGRPHCDTCLLDDLNKEMDLLLYAISHDLRAPLRSILGFSRAVVEDYEEALDDVGKDFLQRIHKAGKQLDAYIDALLMMSRETRGEMAIETFNLSAMAEEIRADLEARQPERKVDFIIQKEVSARADRRLASTLLRKLFENAWKFTSGINAARIEFGKTEENGAAVYFVTDNGAGFDMQYARNRLFGVFQRMHQDEEFEGLGMGLATARRIISRHGGRISATSEVGKGTTITFSFSGF